MDNMYLAIIAILFLLAVFDLIVGVSNDAANFLNSAIGARVAKRSVIVGVAAIGVILGASLSNGMMEIARNGVFVPSQFSFHEVMMLFLSVMLTDVILLDLFNTFGLPTSTTVSMVFELLGAAIAVAFYKMGHQLDVPKDLGEYINTTKVFAIISGIFCSVAVAFTCGCIVMWISRFIFSFRYQNNFRYLGSGWCALALTTMTYFVVFKGLGKSSIMDAATKAWLDANLSMLIGCVFVGWYVICYILKNFLNVNTLKMTALAGTCALALAFAGNDLVNFIGVFMAAESSFHMASAVAATGGDYINMSMEGLANSAPANLFYLVGAGLIMVGALLFSKKARTVTETEVRLARNKAAKERFGSTLAARMMVRTVVNTVNAVQSITPKPIQEFVAKRFEPLPAEEDDGAAFDLIRATVNLTLSALLISAATSLKLPLSTTYVTFMVAMGTSLSDRAWGRDSAVYRITGVLTVIGGWFLTGIVASTGAFITANVLMNLGGWGIVLMIAVVISLIIKTTIYHRKNVSAKSLTMDFLGAGTVKEIKADSAKSLMESLDIYRAMIEELKNEDVTKLRRLRRRSKELNRLYQNRLDDEVIPCLARLTKDHSNDAQIIYQLTESSLTHSKKLYFIAKMLYSHVDNNHKGLNEQQSEMMIGLITKLNLFYTLLGEVLISGDSEKYNAAVELGDEIGDEFVSLISDYLASWKMEDSNLRNHTLFLNLLNETRSMYYSAFLLVKGQEENVVDDK